LKTWDRRNQIIIIKEACYAENMAKFFLIEITQGKFDNFNEVLESAFANTSGIFPVPVLSSEDIEQVREYFSSLIESWRILPVAETLFLTFEL
jgi:hypothetical protein